MDLLVQPIIYCILFTAFCVNGQNETNRGSLIWRPLLDDQPSSNVIIPSEGHIIQHDGILTTWKAYMVNKTGCVSMQVWRQVRHSMFQRVTRGMPRPAASTVSPLLLTEYYHLIGQTACLKTERENQTVVHNILEKDQFRVERGDIVGFRYDRGSPVPYSNITRCTAYNRARQIEISGMSEAMQLELGRLYGFVSLPNCRTYSFEALYTVDSCHQNIAGEQISTVNFTSISKYANECWIIRTGYNYKTRRNSRIIYIKIEELGFMDNDNCAQGFLDVLDGRSSTSIVVKRECGKLPLLAIRPLTSGYVYIRFRRLGQPQNNVNVTFKYSTSKRVHGIACIPVQVSTMPNYIQSPGFPNDYPANADNCWNLTLTLGSKERIRVELSKGIGLHNASTCPPGRPCPSKYCIDFIDVRDGGNLSSPLLNRWCDRTGEDLIETSSGSSVIINFVSDHSLQGPGFRIKVYAVHPGALYCTHRIATPSPNYLQSPLYPHGYPPNRDDCWSIVTSGGNDRLLLTVQDSAIMFSPKCDQDYVEVRDGPGRDSPLLRQWCGSTNPGEILTSGPHAFIRFVSDAKGQVHGFYLDYSQIKSDACTTYYATIFSQSLELKSDGTGSGIQEKCVIIRADSDRVELEWDGAIDTTDSTVCGNNYIEIMDGETSNAKGLGKFCSSVPISPTVTSTGSALFIRWVSDPRTKHGSVKFAYLSLSSGHCLNLAATANRPLYIFTPLLLGTTLPPFAQKPPTIRTNRTRPDPVGECASCFYGANVKDCWNVHTSRGIGQIHFQVKFLDLQERDESGKCLDYLQIFDGDNAGSPSYGKRCGRSLPFNVTTTGSKALMKFSSDSSIQLKGYRILVYALYKDACNKLDAREYDQEIQSLNWPEGGYPVNREWCWVISSPVSKRPIILFAQTLEIGSDDRFEIYDGPNVNSKLLKVWDHTTDVETKINSEGRYLTVVFKSGPLSSGVGRFDLLYKWVWAEGCDYVSLGSDISSPSSKTVMTPGFMQGKYESNDYACWVVTTILPQHRVRVYVDEFELEGGTKCVHDFMEIFDGPHGSDPFLRKWCGEVQPGLIVHSSGRSVYIRFSADSANNYKGFKLSLSTYDEGTVEGREWLGRSTASGDTGLSKKDLAIIICVLVIIVILVLAAIVVWQCRKKRSSTHNIPSNPQTHTIVYSNQPPAYPGQEGAIGGLMPDEPKLPPPDDEEFTGEVNDNTSNQQATEPPPVVSNGTAHRDRSALLDDSNMM